MSKTALAEQTTTTWLAQAFAENPDQVFSLDPFDESLLRIDPARNSRGFTPEIGDKSLVPLIEDIETIGQTTACFATLADYATADGDGVANLYAGFRRARAVQTIRRAQMAAGVADAELICLRVTITPGILTPQEIFERSLSENVFREGMTIMQKVSALKTLTSGEPGFGLTLTAAAKKMNMNKGSASVYLRLDLFPAVAKKAMNTFDKESGEPKLSFRAALGLVALLPSSKEMEAELEEAKGTLLAKAQEKIARTVEKMLEKAGKVTGVAVDAATRKMKDTKGEQANKRVRPTKLILSEIDEELGKLKEAVAAEDAKKTEKDAADRLAVQLAAIKKFAAGGSMKALVKALVGE